MRATFDSREVKPGMTFVALKGEKADGHDFIPQALANGAARIIDGYAELDAAAKEKRAALAAKVIAVTGSAGKTTTKELLKAFFSRLGKTHATEGNFNNHIGLPLTILNCPDDADFLILEMGTNHPGEIPHLCEIASPDVGIVTNIGTAHLEFFGTREAIAKEKGALLGAAKEFGIVSSECFGLDVMPSERRIEVSPRNEEIAAAVAAVLPGDHNLSNASLAFAAAQKFGLTAVEAAKALAGFQLPGARWRRYEWLGVTYIDDSYNANPESMIAALDAFAKEKCHGDHIVCLADMLELGENSAELHRKVFQHAKDLKFFVIGIGPIACKSPSHYQLFDTDHLRRILPNTVKAGDIVLLKGSHSWNLTSALPFGLRLELGMVK